MAEYDMIIRILTEGVEITAKQMKYLNDNFDKMKKYGYDVNRMFQQQFKELTRENKMLDALTGRVKRFNARFLTTMFIGMQMKHVFDGLVQTSLDWVGTNDLMSSALGILFLPLAFQLNNWALAFLDIVTKMDAPTKAIINSFTLFTGGLSLALIYIGTVGNAIINVIVPALTGLETALGLSTGAITGFIGLIGIGGLFIAAALAAKLAYDTNFLGIKDAIDKYIGGARTIVENWETDIATIWTNMTTNALKFGSDFINSIIDGIDKVIPNFKTEMDKIWDRLFPNIPKIEGLPNISKSIISALNSVRAALGLSTNIATTGNALQDAYAGAHMGYINDLATYLRALFPLTATGGIITSPQLRMVGEAGPEAIIPLDRMGMGSPTFNVFLNASIKNDMDLKNTASQLSQYMYDEWRARSMGR